MATLPIEPFPELITSSGCAIVRCQKDPIQGRILYREGSHGRVDADTNGGQADSDVHATILRDDLRISLF
jgi:hypothetical protein